MDRNRIPCLTKDSRHPDWQVLYQKAAETELPWYHPVLDPDVRLDLMSLRPPPKQVLEVGCGLGNQAFELASMGFEMTATDISVAAILRARSTYPKVKFIVDNIAASQIEDQFDLIVDRGCFHVLEAKDHEGYLKHVHRLLAPRSFLILKVFSNEEPSQGFGPERFSLFQLRRIFFGLFEIMQIRSTHYQGSTAHAPKAWSAILRRREHHG